jgi:hypothetical protein
MLRYTHDASPGELFFVSDATASTFWNLFCVGAEVSTETCYPLVILYTTKVLKAA